MLHKHGSTPSALVRPPIYQEHYLSNDQRPRPSICRTCPTLWAHCCSSWGGMGPFPAPLTTEAAQQSAKLVFLLCCRVLVLALTGVLHQLCLCQEADEVVVAAQSEGAEAQLLAAGAVLLDGQGLLDTTADAQLTSPVTLVEPAAAAAVCVPTKNKNYCAVMCPNGGCITDLTASMSAQVAAVGGRVRGKPDRPGADDPPPLGTAPPVVCDVGSTPISGTKMKYTPDDKRFIQTDF